MLLPIKQGSQQQLNIEPFADRSFEFLQLHRKSCLKSDKYIAT